MTGNYTQPSDARDTTDLTMLARGYLSLTRCPGGRYKVRGYRCAHCGVDTNAEGNEGFCGQPVREDGFTPFDATEARRIMQESAMQYEEGGG